MYRKSYLIIALLSAVVFLAGCTKEDVVTPVSVEVSAGDSTLHIRLPLDSVVVTAIIKAGLTANTTYSWTQISGPGVPVFGHQNAISTVVTNLVAGTYVLQFTATNSQGTTGTCTVTIVVSPAVIKTVALQPHNSSTEANPNSYYPTGSGNGILQTSAAAWTHSGSDETLRTYIKFDYSDVPAGAIITGATLTLSSTLTPGAGDGVDANSGTQNACNVQRVTSAWNIATLNWSNQPSTTGEHGAVIPQSTSAFQIDEIDVTQLVKDMITTNNYGFGIQLQSETAYNIRQYASSFYADAARRPKLVITYIQP